MSKCEICGEPVREHEEAAEMYHPNEPHENSVFCHAQCGLNNGMEVA